MNPYRFMVRIQLVVIALLLGFLVGPRFLLGSATAPSSPEQDAVHQTATLAVLGQAIDTSPAPRVGKSPVPDVEAKSVFVWDVNDDRIIFAKHEHDKMPLASVTKMMVALVATELLPRDTKVTIAAEDIREEGDSGLRVGETWTLGELLDFTLVASSNDGASALASVAGAHLFAADETVNRVQAKERFIARMNKRAAELGLTDTHFRNVTGLDLGSVTEGAYGSARDMAMLFEYVWKKHPELFSQTARSTMTVTSEDRVTHRVANTNEAVESLTGVIGSKTGFTELAGGNLVVVVDVGIDHPIVVAVLGSTRNGRFEDVAKLADGAVKVITERGN